MVNGLAKTRSGSGDGQQPLSPDWRKLFSTVRRKAVSETFVDDLVVCVDVTLRQRSWAGAVTSCGVGDCWMQFGEHIGEMWGDCLFELDWTRRWRQRV